MCICVLSGKPGVTRLTTRLAGVGPKLSAKEASCLPGEIKEDGACVPCPRGTYEIANKLCQTVGSLFYINKTGATSDPSDWGSCAAHLPNSQYSGAAMTMSTKLLPV